MTAPRTAAVGVIGLGNMGLPMAETLARAGFPVVATDLDPDRRAAFPGSLDDLAAVCAAAGTLLLSLPGSPQVEAVVRGPEGLLARLSPGSLVIDASTADPASSRALQAQLAAAGHGFVDAPVSGGPAGAAAGRLLVMAGGADDDLARAGPVLQAIGGTVVHLGGPGAGNVVKLINNLLCAAHMTLAGEALALADAAGVEAAALIEALNAGSGGSAVSQVHLPRWVLSEGFDSGFAMGLMRKDLRLAQAMADALGSDDRLGRAIVARWLGDSPALDDADDFTRMVALVRDEARP